jgi:hypothetical protein
MHDQNDGAQAPHWPARRLFLQRSSQTAFAATVIVSPANALISASESWGLEVKSLAPQTMKTLILMSRDIYPHDRIADRYYAIAAKPFDAKAAADPKVKDLIESGVAALDKLAGEGGYLGQHWESDRVALLRKIADTPIFALVRSTLMASLYNQPEIWPLFGHEGECYSKGGYIYRGFDDLDWL